MARKITVSHCIPPELAHWLRREAEKRGLSVSSYLTMVLSEYRKPPQSPDS